MLELKSAKQIARELNVSQHAVEKHLKAVRSKFGATTTNEAARMFAAADGGTNFPYYGSSGLPPDVTGDRPGLVEEELSAFATGLLHGETGAPSLNRPLSPSKTLIIIAAVSFGLIVGLLLLVACAEGIRSLVSS